MLYRTSCRPLDVDPMTNGVGSVPFDRIRRYAREAENSMYKAMRELGKIQSETQFRHEICIITMEQAADPEFIAQTPHAMSQVCFLTQIMKHVVAFRRNEKKTIWTPLEADPRIGANSAPPNPAFAVAA